MHRPLIVPFLHAFVSDGEYWRVGHCPQYLPGQSPIQQWYHSHPQIVVVFLECLFVLVHPEKAVSLASLQGVVGTGMQGQIEVLVNV